MKPADYLLGVGLVCVAVGVGLAPFVIIGLLGILLVGSGLALLIAGGAVAGSPAAPRGRAAGGLAVLVLAAVTLVWAAAEACDLAVRGRQAGAGSLPAARLAVLALVPVPGVLLAGALRLRAGWSWERCVGWGTAAALAALAAAGVFYALAGVAPLDT